MKYKRKLKILHNFIKNKSKRKENRRVLQNLVKNKLKYQRNNSKIKFIMKDILLDIREWVFGMVILGSMVHLESIVKSSKKLNHGFAFSLTTLVQNVEVWKRVENTMCIIYSTKENVLHG